MIDRYNCKEIADIWTDNNKFLLYSKIELTFLKFFKGIEIEVFKDFPDEWVEDIKKIEQRTKHDTAAFVEWLESKVNNRFVHYGLTSSDIIDTAFSLQIKETNTILNEKIEKLITILKNLSEKYHNIIITGRTHGQAAEPILLKNKFSAYEEAINYHKPTGNYYGKLSGSTGDYKYFSREVENKTLQSLGLVPSPISDGQIIHRSLFANHMNQWAVLASSIAKIATDIRLLAQTEICEIQEGFSENQMGSSSMPQKRNPILSEKICGLARVIRGYQFTAMQNIELWNERDISHSSAERIVFPDASILLGHMLDCLDYILSNIKINTMNIKINLEKQLTPMQSQSKMLKLIDEGYSRKEAHEIMRKQ